MSFALLAGLIGMYPLKANAAVDIPGAVTRLGKVSFRGFHEVKSSTGVILLRKNREYLQVVDPSQGAKLKLIQEFSTASGAMTLFKRSLLTTMWKDERRVSKNAFSAINGQFFDTRYPDDAALAFSTRAKGKVYAGYADQTEYRGQKRLLILGPNRHDMRDYDDQPFSLELLKDDAIIGLDDRATKAPGSRIGRTVMGVSDMGKTFLYSSPIATQRKAVRMLQSMGIRPSKMLTLDGGGSSQLVTEQGIIVPTPVRGKSTTLRKIPQAILVEAGE